VSTRRTNGRTPVGLLGAILLIGVVESVVAGRWQALSTTPTLNARYSGQASLGAATHVPVLCLGDSQVKFGIDPTVIQERSGRAAFNLAVAGSPLPLSFYLFQHALEAGARPSAVVVGSMTLAAEPEPSLPLFAEFATIRDCVDLGLASHGPILPARILLARALPSLRYRHAIRDRWLGKAKTSTVDHLALWNAHHGGELVAPEPGKVVRLDADEKARLYGQPWRVSALNAAYFHRFMALAASHGITVYWVVAPIVNEAQKLRDELGLDAIHTKNLQALQASHSNMVLLDARHAGFTAEEFHDSCHLNQFGAERISAAVGDAIASGEGEPRVKDLATLLPEKRPLRK
jgi:hypothetical protein